MTISSENIDFLETVLDDHTIRGQISTNDGWSISLTADEIDLLLTTARLGFDPARKAPEGFVYPVIRLVNPIDANIPVERKSADEVINRLELNYVEYGQMERLLDVGLAALEGRIADLEKLKPQYPITAGDILDMTSSAKRQLRDYQDLVKKTKSRP